MRTDTFHAPGKPQQPFTTSALFTHLGMAARPNNTPPRVVFPIPQSGYKTSTTIHAVPSDTLLSQNSSVSALTRQRAGALCSRCLNSVGAGLLVLSLFVGLLTDRRWLN